MCQPALGRAAELAAAHASWLRIPDPTAQDVEDYLRALETCRRRHDGDAPPEEEARIETARQLWAWCRHRQERLRGLEADSRLTMPPRVAGPVRFAWDRLRELAGASTYPPEPEPPADHAEAVRSLDKAVVWCAGQPSMASTQTLSGGPTQTPPSGQTQPKVILGGRNDRPSVLGKSKDRLTIVRYNVVKAILDAGDAGLAKDELVRRSGHADAVNVLKRLAKADTDWGQVILLAGKAGQHYRIG